MKNEYAVGDTSIWHLELLAFHAMQSTMTVCMRERGRDRVCEWHTLASMQINESLKFHDMLNKRWIISCISFGINVSCPHTDITSHNHTRRFRHFHIKKINQFDCKPIWRKEDDEEYKKANRTNVLLSSLSRFPNVIELFRFILFTRWLWHEQKQSTMQFITMKICNVNTIHTFRLYMIRFLFSSLFVTQNKMEEETRDREEWIMEFYRDHSSLTAMVCDDFGDITVLCKTASLYTLRLALRYQVCLSTFFFRR